jgi:hypothetical protein
MFAIAAVVASILPGKLFAVGSSTESGLDAPGEREAAAPDLIGSSVSDSPERSSRPARDPDEVDYLRALRHEFRTPLNAVLGFSDVLLSGIDGEVNASQTEDLEIIRASGIRLRVLLDSALDISQLAEDELRLDLERVDIRELVGRAAVEAGQLWSNKRDAQCTLPDEPCIVNADEGRLRRSILVLADFLAVSHREADITLRLTPSDDDALPTTAEVLAAEDMTKIRQWPVAVTSELIGRHGGSLYHGSGPSRFMIRLPVGGAA